MGQQQGQKKGAPSAVIVHWTSKLPAEHRTAAIDALRQKSQFRARTPADKVSILERAGIPCEHLAALRQMLGLVVG